jgi:hypothetical protein
LSAAHTTTADPASDTAEYIAWQISPERQRHEWMQLRKSLVAARVRIVVIGHAVYFLTCLALSVVGVQWGSTFLSCGWWSLIYISAAMLGMEWLHVRMLPRTPARFVIRKCGLTEYNEEGPRTHWDWTRAQHLSIVCDQEHPAYRSLMVGMNSETGWLNKFSRFYIPLPENTSTASDIDEIKVIAAVSQALQASGIQWKPRPDGAITLVK